jgi:hypothetical protein
VTLTLQDLTSPQGLQHVVNATGGTQSFYNRPDQALGLAEVAHNAIQRNPALAGVKIRLMPNLPNAIYNFDKGEILLGITNPAALAHEIEHADNIQQQSLYANVLRVAEGIARLNNPGRRLEMLKTLGPAYAMHLARSMGPSFTYQAGRSR